MNSTVKSYSQSRTKYGYVRYICAGTIEERIDAKLRDKRELFQDVVEDVSMDLSATFSETEIFGLLGLAGRRRR